MDEDDDEENGDEATNITDELIEDLLACLSY